MSRTLLVTNDFPPTVGGIQSYLRYFLDTLPAEDVLVFASTQDEEAAREFDAQCAYEVIRWPRRVMLPGPATARRMAEIVDKRDIDVVWFGAAAPLGLMAPAARKAGVRRILASTHGHEVGWSVLPGARHLLRRIGRQADVVTYVSKYTLGRIRPAIGQHPEYVHLPSGVSTEAFRPASAQQRAATRTHWDLEGLVVVCVSRLVRRKGQDQLIYAWAGLKTPATLVIVGSGPDEKRLRGLAAQSPAAERIRFTGALSFEDMRDLLAAADVFAMPVRTRGGGLDVEGLGIVYLEAQACGIPVIAGDSGGAPETVTPETGIVVDGTQLTELVGALDRLLGDSELRVRMGRAGRAHVKGAWTWEIMGKRLHQLTHGL